MNPQQKAKQLVYDMSRAVSEFITPAAIVRGKACAVIFCNEFLTITAFLTIHEQQAEALQRFWQEVKLEIQKIDIHAKLEKEETKCTG